MPSKPYKQVVGRFAPSPTGRMHAGNLFAALMAWLIVKSQDGRMVLRIEDLDPQRSKAAFASDIQRDFEQMGLTWDEGPFFQSKRQEAYDSAFKKLANKQLTYPCFCTRHELHVVAAPHQGEKLVYPGTCRNLSEAERALRAQLRSFAQRLKVPSTSFGFDDLIQGTYEQNLARECGDFIIRRSDGAYAYQLAVVVDDAQQGINTVVRGVDLLCSTPQQKYLQTLLGFPHPTYAHVPLLVSSHQVRLSKRDKAASLDEMLSKYKGSAGLWGHLAFVVGLSASDCPITPEQLLHTFSLDQLAGLFPNKIQILWQKG